MGRKGNSLSTANEESIIKPIDTAEQRKELGEYIDIFYRIQNYLQNKSTTTIKWFRVNCCGPFT